MIFKDLESSFKRAFIHSFDKMKVLFTIPFLFLCGMMIVFCKSISYISNNWFKLILIFLPIFFSFSILYILGVLLVRIYYNEMKKLELSYLEIIRKSFRNIAESLYISIPPVIIFFVLWLIFGLFSALKEIPLIGGFIGVIISFIPFLIILCTIGLCIFNFFVLFFVVPTMSLRAKKKLELVKEVLKNLKKNPQINIVFFLSCISLIFFVSFILAITAILTRIYFFIPLNNLFIGFQWFFLMIPLIIFISPMVIFFFNIASENYNILQRKDR